MPQSGVQPPTADPAAPIDWAHLSRATLGDPELAAEVLQLFARQVADMAAAIRGLHPDTCALVHKLKGSAQGIGAWPVAEAAEHLETRLTANADPGPAVDDLLKRIAAACEAIETHLHNA